MTRVLAFVLAAVAAFAAASDVRAQSAQEFYKDRQITMLVSTAAGGGYDTYARTLARHMTKYIPGNPTIVPKNMPGADGAIAAGSLYNSTPRDGLTFAALFAKAYNAPKDVVAAAAKLVP